MSQNLATRHWRQLGNERNFGELVDRLVLQAQCNQNRSLLHRQTLDYQFTSKEQFHQHWEQVDNEVIVNHPKGVQVYSFQVVFGEESLQLMVWEASRIFKNATRLQNLQGDARCKFGKFEAEKGGEPVSEVFLERSKIWLISLAQLFEEDGRMLAGCVVCVLPQIQRPNKNLTLTSFFFVPFDS